MELVEGDERGDHGFIFKKVGPELRVVEGGFSSIPSQALAISNKFGLTFFLHSQGFCVARTQKLVQESQSLVDSEDEYHALDISLTSIHLPSIQSLALSQDELIIAACMENKIQFYNVPALVRQGKEGSQKDTALLKSLPILDERRGIKMFAWNSVQKGVVLVLSKGGKLTIGSFVDQDLKVIANEVEAADWSPDGEYVGYITSDKNLHICKADLSARSSCELPREMFTDAINGSSDACVDVLKWTRVDSILISCVHTDSNGEEDDSKIFVLVSSQGHFAKDHSRAKILSFEGFFTSIDTSILPPDTGPYTLSAYIPPWELLIVTSRRSIDDHISLLGWFEENSIYNVHKCELLDDRFTPRIELQAHGGDNSVVGLAVDKTTTSIEIPKPNGDSGEKLRPGPVLFCMTLEGNLSLFSLARTGNKGIDVEVIDDLVELPEANEVSLAYGLTCESYGERDIGTEAFDNKSMSSEIMSQEINEEKGQDIITTEKKNEEAVESLVAGTLEKRKEENVEGLQAHAGVPLKQKESSLAVEMKEQIKREQLQRTSVEAASSQSWQLPDKRKEWSIEGIQAQPGVLSKQKEASLAVGMTQPRNSEQLQRTSVEAASSQKLGWQLLDKGKEGSVENIHAQTEVPSKQKETSLAAEITEPRGREQLQRISVEAASSQKLGWYSLDKRKEGSIEGLQAQTGVPSKEKESSLAVEMTKPVNSERLQRTSVEAASGQKLGLLEKRKDLNMQGLQTGAGVPLKQKIASVSLEQTNKPLFSTEKKVTNAPALSEMESEFIRELDEVKGMAMQIDNLIALIEGKRKEKGEEGKPFFTKLLVEDIESKARDLFRQCQSFREQLMEQGRSINDLGDEILQVDYGRVYVQSILEQAFDVCYQELWNKQTLHPEVAALRKRILQADQSLKQQIAELDEHLHNIELSQWHKKHQSKHSNVLSARFEDKSFRFMQSLYDTVNTQMVIAQQLAHRLEAQLEVLKLPIIPNEDMESPVDISSLKLQDMVLQEQSASDLSSKKGSRLNLFRPSDLSPIRAKGSMQTPTKVMAGAGTRSGLQDSTRRRRDSVDKLWVDVGAAKTTVKRAAPSKRFDKMSFSPNKGLLEADNNQLKYGTLHSSSVHNSGSGARSVMTDVSSFNPVQLAERPKQIRADILAKGGPSARVEDNKKAHFTDIRKVQPISQGHTQVTAPTSTTNLASLPSTGLASTAHPNFSSSLKENSTSKTSSSRIAAQSASITNAEKLQVLASHSSLSTLPIPQDRIVSPSWTLSFNEATQMGSSIVKNTVQLKTKPVETSMGVGKVDPSKKALFPFVSQEKASSNANSVFPAPSLSDSQQKVAMNVLQTAVQQQATLTKSEDLKVGKPVKQLVDMGPHQSAPLTASMSSAATDVAAFAGQHGQRMNVASKPEAGIIDNTFANAKENASLAESYMANTMGQTNKSLPVFAEHKSSSPSDMVHSSSLEDPAIGPVSTGQEQSDFVSVVTSSASIKPPHQHLGSSSVVSPFSPSLFQPQNAMSTMSTVQGVSTSSDVTPVASGILSQTSSLFNVSSVSSAKPSEFFTKGVLPAEQQLSSLTASVPTSFTPLTVQGPPVSDEEDMEEVVSSINDFGSSSFAGFGLGSSSSSAGSQHSSPFGAASHWNQSSPSTPLSVPAGQLFKPASFSIPTAQSTSQTTSSLFGSNLAPGAGGPFANASSGFGNLAQPTAAFGQPAQPSSGGQQALGNALGTFGQTRQIGSPFGVSSSPSGFGSAVSGGFAGAATGGGFANAATSGGFAGIAPGGGFASVASGGGFAGVTSGGGFAGAAAAGFSGGGFASFSSSSAGGSSNPNPSGFGGFSGGFSAVTGNTNSSIFTQMRK